MKDGEKKKDDGEIHLFLLHRFLLCLPVLLLYYYYMFKRRGVATFSERKRNLCCYVYILVVEKEGQEREREGSWMTNNCDDEKENKGKDQ